MDEANMIGVVVIGAGALISILAPLFRINSSITRMQSSVDHMLENDKRRDERINNHGREIDAVVRQLPGAIKELSTLDESFSTGLLDAPHYTRPEIWEGEAVPEVLLTGHHANIAKWTREQALEITLRTRPDLIEKARIEGKLSKSDTDWLKKQKN